MLNYLTNEIGIWIVTLNRTSGINMSDDQELNWLVTLDGVSGFSMADDEDT